MARVAAYNRIIEKIFFDHYKKGSKSVAFTSDELRTVAESLNLELPRNPPDVLYSYRHRRPLPDRVRETCPKGEEWVIRPVGGRRYRFDRVPVTEVRPRAGLYQIKLPDATPEIVAQHALSDEQAVLAKVRYNRLIDVFMGIVTYSLQNHLRTQLDGVQLEVDELYVGVAKTGQQFVLPVQAKRGRDRLGRIQLEQDMAFCAKKFPALICRPIAVQLMEEDVIAMFELAIPEDRVEIMDERHYKLVSAEEITPRDHELMRRGSMSLRRKK